VQVAETKRLILRHFRIEDGEFIVRLLNESAFKKFIGDKGVRTVDDAKTYLVDGPLDSYDRFGYGLNVVELKESGKPVGMCGLVRRVSLDDADIGYAFLEQYRSNGYAVESANAIMKHARDTLGLQRIVAIVAPENYSSLRLLEKIGLTFERTIRLTDAGEELQLFASDAQ
jgi:RimJ/RimL family protein N-acetyltransferase